MMSEWDILQEIRLEKAHWVLQNDLRVKTRELAAEKEAHKKIIDSYLLVSEALVKAAKLLALSGKRKEAIGFYRVGADCGVIEARVYIENFISQNEPKETLGDILVRQVKESDQDPNIKQRLVNLETQVRNLNKTVYGL